MKASATMLSQMLSVLDKYLPLPIPLLPAPSFSAVSLTEKAIGVGNWRGNQTRGGFAVVAWKGGRFDGVVRFQLWGNELDDVENALKELSDRLEADKATLRSQGFLRFAIDTISLAEFSEPLNLWFKTADYKALYEFYYKDTDAGLTQLAHFFRVCDAPKKFERRNKTFGVTHLRPIVTLS
jgi:hypothetical protein